MSILILVIADPAAPFLADRDAPFQSAVSRLSGDVRVIVSDEPSRLKQVAPEADIVFYAHGNPELLAATLTQAGRAQWIHSLWTGVESILGPELAAHPAVLTNGRGVFRWPLADWVVGAMLFFAFDLRRVIRQQEEGVWKPVIGTMLEGQTLGIVGYGSIGRAVAERVKPFGVRIVAMRRRSEPLEGDPFVDQTYRPEELAGMMAASDYIVAATPLTTSTRGIIGAQEIAAMKSNAVFINVGRGPVVDEKSLIGALESGAIRGAALDVFETEPLPPGHPFWKMPQVLLSPHTADRVHGFLRPAFDCFFENLDRFRQGQPLANIVDKKLGY
ncbi:MAG TPA: D-2-hydroxyacid dehydrogenase [Terriglobia bacterium]|nr:D-2-hydroxyacid dehydrogenase [Terriglobia bacterium]